MKRALGTLVLAAFLFSGIGASGVYAYPHRDPQFAPPEHGPHWADHDQRWGENHDKQWRDHDREWRGHDREWHEHDGDRDWQERHAHEWRDWYHWHHDNGDEGFDSFFAGVIVGAILGGEH
ncbi:MAG: hypothetical protein ABFC57_15540 [Veillonellales bacterium]